MCQIWTLYLIKHFVTFLFINFGIIFLVTDIKLLYLYLNPIPAGVLENLYIFSHLLLYLMLLYILLL